jgi:hypothetical protein
MADWGTGSWGVGAWGGIEDGFGAHPTLIVTRLPAPGSRDNPENSVITVGFFDADYAINTADIDIYVNGTLAYTASAFEPGFVGRAGYNAGRFLVQIAAVTGYTFGSTVTVHATIPGEVTDTWSWEVRSNGICYSGLTPLPIELAIQQPMTTFLEVEPIRLALMNAAIQSTSTTAAQQTANKQARVVYQWAFETELSTVLNPYALKNANALRSIVCERQNAAIVDRDLLALKDRAQAAINSLYTLRALPKEYTTGFLDYLDSTVYSYRVSLAANMVLLARAVELQG